MALAPAIGGAAAGHGEGEMRMVTVTLYGKAGCHLCDEAREHLEALAAEREFDLREVDIRGDPVLFERYRYRIPVIVVDGDERLEGRIEEQDVRTLLGR